MANNPYRLAMQRARLLQGRLEVDAARRVQAAIEKYARTLEQWLIANAEGLSAQTVQAVEATIRANLAAATRMNQELITGIGRDRGLSFGGSMNAWEAAMAQVGASQGVTGAALGAIRVPPVGMLGQYASLSGGVNWQTLISINSAKAAREANAIILAGIQNQVGPESLARQLRRYVSGAEGFLDAFEDRIDLRQIPLADRAGAKQMVDNSRRIAFSEIHNARAEAETQAMAQDPFVASVKWTLSPVRSAVPNSSFTPPDVCDFLATQDLYGLGEGIYPVNAVPPPPHPYDRCEKVPQTRSSRQATQPKPTGTAPTKDRVLEGQGPPGTDKMTEKAAARMRQEAWDAVSFTLPVAA